MESLVGGENHVLNLVLFPLYVGELGQSTRHSNVTASLLPQPTLLAGNHHL